MKEVAIGVDIGGTFTKIGIVDRNGENLAEGQICTDTHDDIKMYMKELHQEIQNLSKNLPEIKIVGIGVGAPNGNYYNGTIEYAPNLKWKGVIKFVELFNQYFKVPIALTNDANAAALGEMIYGDAKNMKNFIVITLGTGLGSGIVVNGDVVYGHDGFAGELGHVNVKLRGRECGCGQRGCLETYVSATGIKRTVYKLLADKVTETELRKIPFDELTSKDVYEAALKKDPIALEAFEYTGRILGSKLADTVAHTSPEAFFLFGGLAKARDHIFKPTIKAMEESLLPIYRGKVKVLPSGLIDSNVAVMGASALIWKELEKQK